MEQLVRIGPDDPGDHEKVAHLELLAEWTDVDLRDVSSLLRSCFDQVERERPMVLPASFGLDLVYQAMSQTSLWDVVADWAPEVDVPVSRQRHGRPRHALAPISTSAGMPSLFD